MQSNTSVELERTFLARTIPAELRAALPERVVDVYFPDDLGVHPTLRARRRGDRYEITKKTPMQAGDFSHMLEQTIPLEAAEFAALIAGHTRLVEKDRYKVTIAGAPAEVDVFSGELEGLVLIDFEFQTAEAKNAFAPPEACLADVTQEEFIAGGFLAGRTYADIATDLQRFAYQPLHV